MPSSIRILETVTSVLKHRLRQMRSPRRHDPRAQELPHLFHQLRILPLVDQIPIGQPRAAGFLQPLQHTQYGTNRHFGVRFRRRVPVDGFLEQFTVLLEVWHDQHSDRFAPADGLQAEDGAVVDGEGLVGVEKMLQACSGETRLERVR